MAMKTFTEKTKKISFSPTVLVEHVEAALDSFLRYLDACKNIE